MGDLGVDRPPEPSTCMYAYAMVTLLNKTVNIRAIVATWIVCKSYLKIRNVIVGF